MASDEPYCELMDMPQAFCAHCTGQKSVEEQADAETQALRERLLAGDGGWHWFPAEFPGKCGKCTTPFAPKTLIRAAHSGLDLLPPGSWVAECCAVL